MKQRISVLSKATKARSPDLTNSSSSVLLRGNSGEFHYGQAKVIVETELERIHRIDVDDKLDLFGRLDIGDRSMN